MSNEVRCFGSFLLYCETVESTFGGRYYRYSTSVYMYNTDEAEARAVVGYKFYERFIGGTEMTILEILLLLLIAAIAGAIGQAIAGYAAGGLLVTIAVGFIGALIGMVVARALGLPELFAITIGGRTFPLIWSIIGAALFVALIRLITAPARARYA